jgi:hypothetical protein
MAKKRLLGSVVNFGQFPCFWIRIPNTDPDPDLGESNKADPNPGQPKEGGSESTTLPAVPCPGMVEPVEPLELVVPELELPLPYELWLLGLLNKLGPVFQDSDIK